VTAILHRPAQVAVPIGDPTRWSESLDVAELAAHIAWCGARARNTHEQGKRLEQFASWLLSYIPGFRVTRANITSDDGSAEIDIAIWNERREGGFPGFQSDLLVECKNWRRPVSSHDVAWFDWKMRLGGVREGFLIAANGITKHVGRRSDAVAILTTANADQPTRKIFVLTVDELAGLTSTESLRDLIILKSTKLAARDPL
jgi:hypothetical protein